MIEIDGSMGEGGGSILRISLALACIIKEPIKIYKIRANRSKPGLANQHLSAVETLQKLTNSELEGARLGSNKLIFEPKDIEGGKIKVDIGTAGSTTLILQAAMIPAALSNEPVSLEIIGGTDNPFAPPIDYLKNVTIPMLGNLNYREEVSCIRRGHYPKGGGKIMAEIEPNQTLEPITLDSRGDVGEIKGLSHCVKLPDHIAKRQAKSAEERLAEEGYEADIDVEFYKKSEDPHLGPGTGIVLWAETENGSVLGSSSLGKKGKPAEKVGKEAAGELIGELETGKAVDKYMTDQIVPYLALAQGTSIITSTKLTSHTLTNLKLIRKIIGTEFKVKGAKDKPGEIEVEGSGLMG